MPGSLQNADDPQRDSGSGDRGDRSARENASEFRHELEAHLKARAELLSLEVREAGEFIARKGLFGIAAALLLFFAYALLLAAGVALAGQWIESAWPDACAGRGWAVAAIALALLHVLLAFLLVTRLKRKPAQPLFGYTKAEFRKDRQWLQKNHSRSESGDSR